MKQLLVLVGPKGAGKSTIGHLLAEQLGIHFVRVEPLFLQVRDRLGASHPEFERQGFHCVVSCLKEAFTRYDTVCIESTGASEHFGTYLAALSELAQVLLIRVLATPGQCAQRIHGRNASLHIPVSDDQVDRINALAAQVSLPWHAELDNRETLAPDAIAETVRQLLRSEEHRGA